jgi:hypothetical protein
MTGADQWFPFPLLQLTAPAVGLCSKTEHHFVTHNLPFVTDSNFLSGLPGLPGPSPDDLYN